MMYLIDSEILRNQLQIIHLLVSEFIFTSELFHSLSVEPL